VGEILKFFGIMILCTKFEFRSRSSLWSTTSVSKYIPAPSFGTTGMSRMRFDDLWRYIRWSRQPVERPPDMTSEQFRWRLVDDFVGAFNDHRASTFQPSEMICVDESISRWYGKGGHWINHGLPMYVAMERKPDNGCEIQNSACGKSGIMMRLKLVKTADENRAAAAIRAAESPQLESSESIPHSAAILRELVLPWIHTDRIVCADSYFASVPAAKLMSCNGMRFIGVVKTATRNFPMRYLASVELNHRGDRKGLVSNAGRQAGDPSMLAFVWMDRQRRYFIATASSLEAGTPYKRWRWRQVDTVPNADPSNVELLVPQPKAAEVYYSACGMIDRHNRARQDTLGLEGKLETHDWAIRVNMTIFAMTVVDTWLAYSQCTETQKSQKDFYTVNVRGRRNPGPPGMSPTLFERASGGPRAGCFAHLTPTKKRKRKDGVDTPYALQGRCKVCKMNVTTYVCSLCMDENPNKEAWVCYTRKRKTVLCHSHD
jgi:Transposase IS4